MVNQGGCWAFGIKACVRCRRGWVLSEGGRYILEAYVCDRCRCGCRCVRVASSGRGDAAVGGGAPRARGLGRAGRDGDVIVTDVTGAGDVAVGGRRRSLVVVGCDW